ncbi:MAG: hypothetical protein J0I75_29205 [Hyphomicrobium sp.]|nr:hypothetical protein [Hyphomicrobium sp.]
MRALVLVPVLTLDRARQTAPANGGHRPAPLPRASADRLDEAIGLAQAIDLDVAGGLVVPVPQPRPATLFGSGKVEEIKAEIEARETGLVIVDHAISPVQQRNLERAWNVKVIDRTGLILEIFGRRARTREGRLQVELAHLSYQKSRLVRSWTHLERQRGGGGFLGGPGERQLELDRRMLQDRIDALKKELEGVVRTLLGACRHRMHREPDGAVAGQRRDGSHKYVYALHMVGAAKEQYSQRLAIGLGMVAASARREGTDQLTR